MWLVAPCSKYVLKRSTKIWESIHERNCKPGGERCGGGASGRQCQLSLTAEIKVVSSIQQEQFYQVLKRNQTFYLEEEHEGGIEGGKGGEEAHGSTPDIT